MSRAFVTKTSFTAGELDPLLRGRLDLKAQEDGAARLRNVVVHPSGGVSRRPGLRLVASVPGARRLVTFEGADGGELLAFGPYRLDILRDGVVIHAITDTLWGPAEIPDLSAARWGDRLLICHPSVPPKELIRNGVSGWQLRDWTYEESLDGDGQARSLFPFARFVRPEIAIHVNDATGAEIAAGSFVSLLTSEPVFTPDHIDAVIMVKGKHIRIVNPDPVNPQQAYGVALQTLKDGKPTRDWQEQAFSEAHGWPACVAVHQERLVIGGSRDVPDRLWFSKTGHPFNFDPGHSGRHRFGRAARYPAPCHGQSSVVHVRLRQALARRRPELGELPAPHRLVYLRARPRWLRILLGPVACWVGMAAVAALRGRNNARCGLGNLREHRLRHRPLSHGDRRPRLPRRQRRQFSR